MSINDPSLPLLASLHTPAQKQRKKATLAKELTVLSTTAIIINQTVGSGVLITPSSVLKNAGSFGLSVTLWALGGAVAYLASFCYLELALMVKKSGSTYVYVMEAYSFGSKRPWIKGFGSLCGFLMVWTDIVIGQPLGLAVVLLAMARYMCRPFFIDCDDMPIGAVKMIAMFTVVLLGIVNVYSMKMTTRLLNWLSSVKLLSLVFIIALGAWKLIQLGGFPGESRHPFAGSATSPSQIALGFYGVMWAYDGWNAGVMVQEETKNNFRAVVGSTVISTPVIMVVYVLTNTAFFAVLSYDQILSSTAVGLYFGQAVLKRAGVIVFSVIGVVLTFGSALAGLLQSSRELFVASREGTMPQIFSGIHVTYRTPLLAVVAQCVLAGMYILIGNIESLINLFTSTLWFWYGSAMFGLIVMRLTQPNRERPFKVILLLPSVMVVVSVLLVVLPLWQDPVPQLIGFAGVLAGLPVYALFVMKKPCRLKPKILDRLNLWLIYVTSRTFNTELSDAF